MSLLTRIHNLRARYRTNQGNLTRGRGQLQDLGVKRSTAYKTWDAYKKGDFETARGSFQDSFKALQESKKAFDTETGTMTTMVQSFVDDYANKLGHAGGRSRGGTRVVSADDLPEVVNLEDYLGEGGQEKFNTIAKNYYKSRIAEFSKDERAASEYFNWVNIVEHGGAGSMMSTIYERAKPYIAQFERTVTKPYEQLVSDAEAIGTYAGEEGAYGKAYSNLESSSSAYTTAQGAYESASGKLKSYYDSVFGPQGYDRQIQNVRSSMQTWSGSLGTLQGQIGEAEYMYGVSNEQRKRGTRESARRRTALTSRSGYA